MLAFVLSGGGNRGALQVGALQVLLEAGVKPEMLVGTSAGAVNAAFLAADPTPARARVLAEVWQQMTKENIYPGGPLRVFWHLVRQRDSLYPGDHFRDFLETNASSGMRFFYQLAIPLYIVTTELSTGRPFLFGDDSEEAVLDAVMASISLPPLFAPWSYHDHRLIDGGVVANLPVNVAVEKGATEVYALEIENPEPPQRSHWNLWEIAVWSISALVRQQWERDLALCAAHPEVTLHYLPLYSKRHLAFDDFSHTTELIVEGRAVAKAYLAAQGLPQAVREKAPTSGWKRTFQQLGREIEWPWRALTAQIRRSTRAEDKQDLILNKSSITRQNSEGGIGYSR